MQKIIDDLTSALFAKLNVRPGAEYNVRQTADLAEILIGMAIQQGFEPPNVDRFVKVGAALAYMYSRRDAEMVTHEPTVSATPTCKTTCNSTSAENPYNDCRKAHSCQDKFRADVNGIEACKRSSYLRMHDMVAYMSCAVLHATKYGFVHNPSDPIEVAYEQAAKYMQTN